MQSALQGLATAFFSFVYAFLGLMIGACSGFILLKLAQGTLGLSDSVTAVLQLAVAAWAILLAVVAAAAYVKTSKNERFVA